MRKNNRAARAAHFLVQFFDVVCQTTTWNFHIWASDGNASPQQKISHSLPLHENHSCQASESTLRQVCTTWPTWNNRLTLNLTRSSILMWRYLCNSRLSFLNSLVVCVRLHLPIVYQDGRNDFNRPFQNNLWPVFQSEAKDNLEITYSAWCLILGKVGINRDAVTRF